MLRDRHIEETSTKDLESLVTAIETEGAAMTLYEVEMELFRRQALKAAIRDVLQSTEKRLSDNDLVIILQAACAELPDTHRSVSLPEDTEEALQLVALLRSEVEQ